MNIEPSVEEKQTFWKTLARELSSGDEVFVAKEHIQLEALKDAMGEALPGLEGLTGKVALFFIDRDPRANWAHPCDYVLLFGDGRLLRLSHQWPPHESISLTPLR